MPCGFITRGCCTMETSSAQQGFLLSGRSQVQTSTHFRVTLT